METSSLHVIKLGEVIGGGGGGVLIQYEGFPGGSPVVKTQSFHCREAQGQCLVRELRSHKPCSVARLKKKKKKNPK